MEFMSGILFWDVDTQVDFMLPEGRLYAPGAEKIITHLKKLTEYARQNSIPIISSVDAHKTGDPEFAQYPPHCVVGTIGQSKVDGTILVSHYVIPNRKIVLPENLTQYKQIILEKEATDVFTNPNTEEVVNRIASGGQIVLYGVVTEICVDQAARGLIARGHPVHVVTDAIQAFEHAKGEETLAFIGRHGGRFLMTEEVLNGAPARSAA